MAVFALDPEPEHLLAAALRVDGGFRATCSCGWHSAVRPEAVAPLEAWADHVRAVEGD